MLLKIKENKMRISSAGMPPALIYRRSKKSVEEILIKGMPLGTAKAFPWEERETILESGDTILLMSDGFPELFNNAQQMFGYKSVQNEFLKHGEKKTDEIIEELRDSMTDWSGGQRPHDDVTFVVLKVN
jgi:sigma-B regulation protein RsbU (phosphoserine phosphatase)